MRTLYSSMLFFAAMAAASAAEVAHNPNLFASDDLQSKSHIYTWSRPVDEIATHTPYLAFFVGRSNDHKPVKPTIVVHTKTIKGLRPECRQPQWLVDGEPMEQQSYHSNVAKLPEQGVLDNLYSIFTLQALRKIASASEVKYALCESEYKMTRAEVSGLKDVLGLYDGKLYIPDHPPHD